MIAITASHRYVHDVQCHQRCTGVKTEKIKYGFNKEKSGESVITFVGSGEMNAEAGAQSARSIVKCTDQRLENCIIQHYSDAV